MTSAEPADGEAVRVTAEVDGNRREAETWVRVDRGRRHLDWGSEGDNDDQRIDQGLSDTLGEIARLVEAGPAPSAATVRDSSCPTYR